MLRACPHHGFTELAQIDTFYNGLNDNDQDSLNAAAGGNLFSKTTREALQIIKNKSKVCYSRNKLNVSRMNTTSRKNASKSNDRIDKLADQISTLVDIFAKKIVASAPVKAVEESCVTCGGAHGYYNCPNTDSNQPSINLQNIISGFFQNQSSTSGTLPSNTIPNPKGEMKAITTRSGVAYEGPAILTPKKVVEQETKEITDKEQSNFQGSTAHIQPSVTPIPEPDVPKTLLKPNIPYPSRLNDQKLREKATNQMEKFFQIFQDLHFDISFADALILMTKFASTIKSLLTNKDKLFELAKIPLNENCSAMLLKKLPKKLGDPGKFLIPCDFSGMNVFHALSDLKLADRSITHPKGVVEDVFIKVRKFHFLTDFVVVDFEADPRVPLILGRSFLRTDRALIDVYGEEITLREILGFSSNSSGGNSTLTFEPILSDSSPSLTPFKGSDFILEEIDAYLKDESVSSKIDHADCDPKGDICLIEKLLNNDSFQLPSMDLKQGEVVNAKSSIKEPQKLELKELPSHLEYAYLEGADKLPMLERLAGNEFYCFLDGFSSYFQILINPPDQEKTTFTCPYGTFAYRRIPFGLCNTPGTFQRCMMAIFHDMIEKTMEFFMDDFLVFGDSFSSCLSYLDTMLQRCEYTNLVLNWEKCHFMVKERIVIGHKIYKNRLEVDHSKVDVIAKLPYPMAVKGVRSFLGHAGFYRRFIQDFSKIARPMTHLLEKETPFVLSKDCIDAFKTLKKKLTEAPILVVPDWNLPFELMCDASDFAIGAMVESNGGNQFRQYAGQNTGNPAGYNDVIENQVIQNAVQNPRVQNTRNQNGLINVQGNGNQNQIGNGNLVATRAEGNAAGQNGNQIRCYNCRGIGIQLQAEEFDLMAAAADLDDIEEVNANCILMANLQQVLTSGTQFDSTPVYDTDESAEVHKNYDDNEIFNMFTQEEHYTELLEPIPELHQVPQNDNDVVSEVTGVEQGGEIVEQHPTNFEETRALYDSLY
nr:reverse transcriptase domain-containing protein [Tanacetum cinerariifolium]